MAFYQVSGSKRFSVSNPTNQIEVQLEQLQAKLDALSTSSPSTRLFLNYPETNTDYFNQPSNVISMQTKALPSQETLETVIVGKGNTEIELFGTIPLQTILTNKAILEGDVWNVNMWCKTMSTNCGIRFQMFIYNSLLATGTMLCNSATIYPILPSNQPYKQTFSIPMTTTVVQIEPVTQLFFIPTLVNAGTQQETIITYFGGSTPSYISVNLESDTLPPNETWYFHDISNTNVQASCFQFDAPVETIPFSSLGMNAVALHQESFYYTNTSNYFMHISQQNIQNNTGFFGPYLPTGGTNSYLLRMQDVYDGDNYAVFQLGPLAANLTGPADELVHIALLSFPLVADGVCIPQRPYHITILPDWQFTGSIGPFILPTMMQLNDDIVSETLENRMERMINMIQSSQAPTFEEGVDTFYELFGRHLKKQTPTRVLQVKAHNASDLTEDEIPLGLTMQAVVKLPIKVDLRGRMSAIRDQGSLGSCTAFALESQHVFKTNKSFIGSPLYLYYNERVLDNSVLRDAGSTITTGIRALKTSGLCTEATWPYIISKFTQQPPQNAFTEGQIHKVLSAVACRPNLSQLKTILSSGNIFTFGFLVYSGFMSSYVSRTGIVSLPKRGERLLGGHAVTCVGYDDTKNCFIVRNSWGTSWGDAGYFYMSYNYLANSRYCWDFWSIQNAS
jgi:C1A family cysteine protease